MSYFEIMIVIRPEMEPDEYEEILSGISSTITTNGGILGKVIDWRKRRLAYEIDKQVEGHYYLVYFSGRGTIIPELEHFFRVNDTILRFMTVRIQEEDYENATAEETTTSVNLQSNAASAEQVQEEVEVEVEVTESSTAEISPAENNAN